MLGLPFIHWLVVLSTIISIAGASAYIRDTYAGRTKPNRVSWSMWALAPLIGSSAAIASGADGWATFRVFLAGFLPLLVFLVSFINPKSYWKLTRFDFTCGALSLLAIILWILADSPRSAVLLTCAADLFAGIPTIRKAWHYPETETGIVYIASFFSVVLILPAIPVWNIENSAFQITLLVANALLVFSVYRKRFGIG